MALNGLVTASADKTAAHRWWNDMETDGQTASQELQETIAYVQQSAAPWFVVNWQGYAGSDPDFELYDLAKQPTTIMELSQAADNPRVALEAEDGYWSYTSKEGLLKALQEESARPDSDGSEFQSDETFESPVDLPDWEETRDRLQEEEDEEVRNRVPAPREERATIQPATLKFANPAEWAAAVKKYYPGVAPIKADEKQVYLAEVGSDMLVVDGYVKGASKGPNGELAYLIPPEIPNPKAKQSSAKTAESRQLFDKFVSRKPEIWSQARKVDWNRLDEEQQAAIKALPLLEIPPDVEPMSNEIDQFFPQDKTGNEPIEWLVETFGGGYFYVNTEGYTYARYAFQIVNYPEGETAPASTEGRVPMNASDKTAGPFDLINSPSDYSHGAPSNEGPDDAKGQSVDDMVTASSVISSVSEILGNTSMDEEARIWRAYEALSDYIREAPVPEHQGSDKTAGPIDVENPAKSVEPNRAEVVLQQIADAMKEKSPHGSLNILEGSPHSRSTAMEPLLNAINKMLAAGFTFTPEEIEWITWPAEPYSLEGPPTEELRTQYDALGAKIRAVPGYEELDQILNSFYQ